MRDLLVVLPGILGSTLAKDRKLVWAPSAGAVLSAIRTFGRSIKQLELPAGVGDEHPGDGVEPVALMPDFHVLPGIWTANLGYGALLDWLRSRFHLVEAPQDDPDRCANFLPIAYDWRLSNRYNGRRLKDIVEPALEKWRSQGADFADAKIIFVCHSMGGLVARWYIDREGGAELTRKLITLGTPHRGSLKALSRLVNGMKYGIGPLGLNLTSFARSLPAMYQLLPEYACIETADGLAKTTAVSVPILNANMTRDAMFFHDQLDESMSSLYQLHPLVGFRQPTEITARIRGDRVEALGTIRGQEEGGDGTVPRLAATPKELAPGDASISGVAEMHGSLQSNQGVLDGLEFVLGARTEPYMDGGRTQLSIVLEEVTMAGDPLVVTARSSEDDGTLLQAVVRDETGDVVTYATLTSGQPAELELLPAGGYSVTVGAVGAAAGLFSPVTCPILVWADEEA